MSQLPPANKLIKLLKSKPEAFWLERGHKMALGLFNKMSETVPAYRDFLKKNKCNPAKIKSYKDFKNIPSVSKDNYLRKYDLKDLCWNGDLKNNRWTIASTSGTTGEPFYFPRTIEQDKMYALTAELYLLTNFLIDRRSTLYINAFPMGPWIGGVFTYEAIRMVAEGGKYPLSIFTAGIDKKEVINAVKKFGKKFDQILIGSYAPFLKDILHDGVDEGVNWKNFNLGFIFSAEGFSEEFRDYVINITGLKDKLRGTLNHYGTVDLGTMSYETPLSILIRKRALKNQELYNRIFGDTYKLPTFTQYLPEMFYFEEEGGNLFCSSYSGVPLVRYDLRDHGGVRSNEHVMSLVEGFDPDFKNEIIKSGIRDSLWQLPFVHVYERSDLSISYYAFNIYPETVKRALTNEKLAAEVTGKFTMTVEYNSKMDQELQINVELRRGKKTGLKLKKIIQEVVANSLIKEVSEFRKTYQEKGKKIYPRIILWPYESPNFFKPGTKQKWVKKHSV